MRVGRNEPCPCGSGKKYKKCCLPKEEQARDVLVPEDLKTGTLLDKYFALMKGVVFYGRMLMQFGEYSKELSNGYKLAEKELLPGTDEGVTDAMFMSWFFLDYRFGKTNETICERFIKSEHFAKLCQPAPVLLPIMSNTYCAFYEIKDVLEDRLIFEELTTSKIWSVVRINEPFERDALKGDIWFLRFMGTPEEGYIYNAPFIHTQEAKNKLSSAIIRQIMAFSKDTGRSPFDENIFRDYWKASVPAWMSFFVHGNLDGNEPKLTNSDGESIYLSKTYFKIKQLKGLAEKLSSLRNLNYIDENNHWIWIRKGYKRISSYKNTILGTIYIKGNRLIGETNSLKRALKLKNKLSRGFNDFLSYEKIESTGIAAMPPISTMEKAKIDKEQKELLSNPEMREHLRKLAEDYYHNDWLKHRIPALDNKTPFQAVKTEYGRRKAEALLDDIDRMQNAKPDDPHRVNVNGLREKLGLPLKN